MPLAIIVAFSALAAVVAAGFTWYGWALVENMRVWIADVRTRRAAKAAAEANDAG